MQATEAEVKQAKENLKGLPIPLLEERMKQLGHPAFRARQLFHWIYGVRETDFDKMTNLSKKFRQELAEHFEIPRISVAEARHSNDGTVKYIVRLLDGHTVESVFIPTEGRNTLCISSQVGCKMACTFCATGYMRFTRNLQAWEIVDQLISIPTPEPVTNVVMMGMGEPFDNYDEVIKALQIMQDPMGPKIGKRHITVSTVGLVPKMQPFVDANLGRLAISLHGTTEEQRASIMPINRKYNIEEVMETCRQLKFKGQGRVTFEYLMIQGVNDSDDDARRLVKLVRGMPCKINLLAYNENPYISFRRPAEERVLAFQAILLHAGLTATYRRSRGRDIGAACGQLRTEIEKRTARGRA